MSVAALVVLSVLLALQLLGLGYFTYYLYHVPTSSCELDALAMARIGASLEQRELLPPIGPVSNEGNFSSFSNMTCIKSEFVI